MLQMMPQQYDGYCRTTVCYNHTHATAHEISTLSYVTAICKHTRLFLLGIDAHKMHNVRQQSPSCVPSCCITGQTALTVIAYLKPYQTVLHCKMLKWPPHEVIFTGGVLQAQRFLALVLLPHVRNDIQEHKRCNFALFQAMKKATYKPDAFFKVSHTLRVFAQLR